MKKKIIHLIGHLEMGGAESLVTEYGMKIDKKAFDTKVVTLENRKQSSNEDKLTKSNVDIIYLGNDLLFPKASSLFTRLINKIHRYVKFSRIIKKEKPHIIHSHLQTNDYLVPLNIKKCNIKLFHTLHNEVSIHFRKSERLYRWATLYCVKRKGMHIIALHEQMMEEAKALFKTEHVSVLHNGINTDRFNLTDYDRLQKRRDHGIPEDAYVIGHIGRFMEQKNHLFLIDIFKACRTSHPSSHLLLIGSGVLKEEIENRIADYQLDNHVTLLENRSDIPELMNIMDVFLFPSLYEGFPIVLLEAQAANLRCVVSETITKEVMVTENLTYLSLIDPIEMWAEAILKEGSYLSLNNQLGQFDIANIINELQQLYLTTSSNRSIS